MGYHTKDSRRIPFVRTSPIIGAIRKLHSSASLLSKPAPSEPQPYSPSTARTTPSNTQTSPKTTKPPLSALNSAIVNNITTPNGARPNRTGQNLPTGYNTVARKVTLAIVALPVLLVTSWVLWDRLVMGKEKKELIRPFLKDEEQPADSDFLRGRK